MFQTTKWFKYVELMFPSLPPLNPSTLIRIPTWQLLLQHQRSVVQVEPAKLGADAGIGGKQRCLHHEELHLAALPMPELWGWCINGHDSGTDLLEVPTIEKRPMQGLCKAYVREYAHKIWPYMVQYLHFRILELPLNIPSGYLTVCHWKWP